MEASVRAEVGWYCSSFPLKRAGDTTIDLPDLIALLQSEADQATEEDIAVLGQVLHVAHILKTLQGADGRWPRVVDAQSGAVIGSERTFAPVPLFERLNAMLNSSEFELAINDARAGGYSS